MLPPESFDATSHSGLSATGSDSVLTNLDATVAPSNVSKPTKPDPRTNRQRNKPSESQPITYGSNRYPLGEELARGGWGRVYLANDQQLNRMVAVKRIATELAGDTSIQSRFFHEAKITGQLQHPGIVPVHELGIAEDGAPFYVMKLLESDTFKDAIRQVHETPDRLTNGYSIDLLKRYIDICHAVAYAHQQQIVHRDLKPANILVGRFGETIVADWGLATNFSEVNGTADATPSTQSTPVANQEQTVGTAKPTLGPTASPTNKPQGSKRYASRKKSRTGPEVVGTPSYMSPEQALGGTDSLQPATDIYALGVILYEVLTGANPFRADDIETTLQRIKQGSYLPPRSIHKRIPRALAAICTTAMAHRPGDRYQSAGAIVEDLQRFMEGEAVSVCPDPWWMKALRWCRRRPALTAGVLGSGVVLTIASLIFSAIVQRAHEAEHRARIAAEQAQQEALQRLAESRQAGDAWLIDLSGTLQFFPGMEGIRNQLLEQATEHYQRLAGGLTLAETIDPTATLENAKCLVRLGDLHRLLQRPEASALQYRAAMQLLDTSLAANDNGLAAESIQRLRAERINAKIGNVLLGQQEELSVETRWLQDQLESWDDQPTEDSHQMANTFARLVLAIDRSDSFSSESITLLYKAENGITRLVEERGQPRDHQLLQTIRDALAQQLEKTGATSEAAKLWQREIGRLTQLLDEQPDRPDLLQSRAFAQMQVASLYAQGRKQHESAQGYRSAIQDLETAWQLSDAESYYRRNTAVSHANLGSLLAKWPGEKTLAEGHLAEAIERLRETVAAEGIAASDLKRMADCYESLAQLAVRQGDPNTAKQFSMAEQCYTILRDHQQLGTLEKSKWARLLAVQSRWLTLNGDLASAEASRSAAEAMLPADLERTEQLSPQDLAWTDRLEIHLLDLQADWLFASGSEDQAKAKRLEAMDHWRALSVDERDLPEKQGYPVAMETLVDRLLERTDRTIEDLTEASVWISTMIASYPECGSITEWRQRQAIAHWLAADRNLALIEIKQAIALSPEDRLSQLVLLAIETENSPNSDKERLNTYAKQLAEEYPGDRRVQFWANHALRP